MKLKLNLRKNLIILLIIIPFLLLLNLIPLSEPKQAIANDDYIEKIVAVVYDDSGSMRDSNSPKGKFTYAKYAMQVLMANLDSRDTLKVFQLNTILNNYSEDFEVDLKVDRQTEINRCISKLRADGGSTPATQIKNAIDWLKTKGLNDVNIVDGKEFSF